MVLDEETVSAANLSEGELRRAFNVAMKWESWRRNWERPVDWVKAGTVALLFGGLGYELLTGAITATKGATPTMAAVTFLALGSTVAADVIGTCRKRARHEAKWEIVAKAYDKRRRVGGVPAPAAPI